MADNSNKRKCMFCGDYKHKNSIKKHSDQCSLNVDRKDALCVACSGVFHSQDVLRKHTPLWKKDKIIEEKDKVIEKLEAQVISLQKELSTAQDTITSLRDEARLWLADFDVDALAL